MSWLPCAIPRSWRPGCSAVTGLSPSVVMICTPLPTPGLYQRGWKSDETIQEDHDKIQNYHLCIPYYVPNAFRYPTKPQILWGPHFIGGKTEAQRSVVTFVRKHWPWLLTQSYWNKLSISSHGMQRRTLSVSELKNQDHTLKKSR